jgi:predicted CXXCH cytochrome family protein
MVNTHQQHAARIFSILIGTLLFSLFIAHAHASGEQTENHCDYSARLDDPATRNSFLAMKDEMALIAKIRKESLETGRSATTVDESTSFRQLDELSKECIGCHGQKGKMAVREIIEAYYPPVNSAMNAIYATHAIGTDYVAASIKKSGLRDIAELPANMTLINGRIACVTCHNPLSRQKNSLAVDNSGSALCFSCHRY